MSLGAPHLLWLLVIVPLLVVAYTLDGQRRKRVLDRIGYHCSGALRAGQR